MDQLNTDKWLDYHEAAIDSHVVNICRRTCLEQASHLYGLAQNSNDPKAKFLLMGVANLMYELENGTLTLMRHAPFANTGRY